MAYSSNSSTGSVGTSSIGSSIGTTSTGTSGASVGTSASTGMSSSGPNSTGGSTGTPNNTGFTGLSYSNGTWSPNSNSLGTLSLGTPGLSGFASNNFGTGWSDNGSSSEPTMTVDEVYGKSDTSFGNQSIVESQGDYNATSNEKSNVETSTFGKQDDITVTPESVTENKGIVDNSAIESIEGLNFQQKDKESQDVLEARKSRDDAEAEDKSNQMRDSLKAKTEQTAEEDAANQLQIGDRDEDVAAAKAKADEADKAYKDLQAQADDRLSEINAAVDNLGKAQRAYLQVNKNMPYVDNINEVKSGDTVTLSDGSEITPHTYVGKDPDIKAAYDDMAEAFQNLVQADATYADKKSEWDSYVNYTNNAKAEADKALADYNSMISEKFVGDEDASAVTTESTDNAASDTKQTFDNAIQNAVEKGADEQTVQAMTDIATSIVDAQATMKQAIEQNDIPTYIEAQKQYNKNLNEALQIGNRLTQTDYNKNFVTAVAKANDFEVTLADGTKTTYSQFATDMSTKSPEVAKAMYEAKAARLEEEGHTILARVERAKAEMVTTWLGSKFTFADNQVRNQFNQMAKTNMRATYATYNNVLNDPNATPEQKAEASAAINQANALMTASAALQASTGFLSGIGDSMNDGVYGVTDPTTLNAYQKTLNAIDNYAKITLGLGVTPSANKAYQNMYYMAGAKVSESGLFGRDFDSDGFALCQEYGNSAAAGMITGAGELATGVALFFNPAMASIGLNLVIDSVQTFMNGLFGVQIDARKSQQYTQEVLSYFKEAESIAAETGNKEVMNAMSATMSNAVKQIENFELKADEVGNLDNWLEGSGSNTATNEKFNQSLTYDEWLKLIEADPTMRDYAKKLIAEKKEK